MVGRSGWAAQLLMAGGTACPRALFPVLAASVLSPRRHADDTARCHARPVTDRTDLLVSSLGEGRYDSPLSGFIGGRRTNEHYVQEEDPGVLPHTRSELA